MNGITISALAGGTNTVPAEALENLARDLSGEVLLPDDEGYAAAVQIWNGMVAKRPAVVIQPETPSDVARVVRFVAEFEIELSVKGGGHNIAGTALSDGGITLDMSRMKTTDVDVESRLARVGAGCTLGDVDRATQRYGLAATLGFVSETGVAGLTLGGGFGYLTRQFGYTVDDLEEVEIVTADSEILRASTTRNEELFWALRGGGGNFGVVTEFVFRLHEIGPEVTAGLIAWSAEEAAGALEIFRDVTTRAPRQLTMAALMRNAPPAPWLPEDKHGQPMVAFVVNHTGTVAEARADLESVRAYGNPWADLIQVKPYAAQQSMLDATQPKGMSYYWKSEFLPGLTDELLATYRSQFENLTAPANQIVLFHLAGVLDDLAEDDGAVGNRDAAFACVIQSMFPGDSPAAEANVEWVRSAWRDLYPFSTGGNYVNFQTHDEADYRIAAAYRGNLGRLAEVKRTYDPGNLFRLNRNITPGAKAAVPATEEGIGVS